MKTFVDFLGVKVADFLWWLANSDYQWKANLFYPIYCKWVDWIAEPIK